MNVFLAGKVDEKHGQWRDALLRPEYVQSAGCCPAWALYTSEEALDSWGETYGVLPWPVKTGAVMGQHAYVGPYRQIIVPTLENKYSGYFHGVEAFGNHGCLDIDGIEIVAGHCRRALNDADLVFAYVNSIDAYGTLVDIGYAFARGRFVYAVVADEETHEDLTGENYEYVAEFTQTLTSITRVGYRFIPDTQEDELLRQHFRQACMEYIGWKEQQEPRMSLPPGRIQSELQQIAKWSADPRVRTSVQNLLARLPS